MAAHAPDPAAGTPDSEPGTPDSSAATSGSAAPAQPTDDDPRRWWILALVSSAMLLSLSAWMTATAVGPELQARWSLGVGQVGLLTTTVQLGFVLGTALAAGANLTLLVIPAYEPALVARLLTGVFLAGVYPPGMKMVSTWFRSGRGLAIGTAVGALTIGKALPYLLKAIGGPGLGVVVTGASVAGLLAATLVFAGYRDGPFSFPCRPFEWSRVGRILGHRETMLATGGYLGHMWELYAMWTWVPTFLAVAAAGRVSESVVDLIAFGSIAAGGLGCVWGGVAADRVGRDRVVVVAMAVSATCCLAVGLLVGAPFAATAALTLVWGFFVVADSAQFSAMVTEVAPPDSVGTALMLQTSMGFLLTMVTIQALPMAVELVDWHWAFAFLALGPVAGISSIRRLVRHQRIHSAARP